MTNLEKEALETKGIKDTICPPRNAFGSGGQKFHLIQTSFHRKKKRSNHGFNGPNKKVVSGIYGNIAGNRAGDFSGLSRAIGGQYP